MLSNTAPGKWFYPAQKEATKELRKRFEQLPCNYQLIEKDRVIESYTGIEAMNKQPVLIQVDYCNSDNGSVSVMIYEMNYLQGWAVTTQEAKPFTLQSYEGGLRQAWTRNGDKVIIYLRTDGFQRQGWPMVYSNPGTGRPTHITRNGTMFRTNEETIFDIFESNPVAKC